MFWRPVGLKFDKKASIDSPFEWWSSVPKSNLPLCTLISGFPWRVTESQKPAFCSVLTTSLVEIWQKNFNWVSIWVMIKCAKITSTPLHFDFRLHMKSHRENTEPRNPAICNVLTTSWVETWRKSFNRVSFWVMIKCAKIKSVPLHFVFRLLM